MAKRLNAESAPATHAILGAVVDVHRELGPGYLEAVYQEALQLEMEDRGIPFVREAAIPIHYKGIRLETRYRADFICFGDVLVELKAQDFMSGPEEAQMINYLRATQLELGLLVNFGLKKLQVRRFVLTNQLASVDSVSSVAGSQGPQPSSGDDSVLPT